MMPIVKSSSTIDDPMKHMPMMWSDVGATATWPPTTHTSDDAIDVMAYSTAVSVQPTSWNACCLLEPTWRRKAADSSTSQALSCEVGGRLLPHRVPGVPSPYRIKQLARGTEFPATPFTAGPGGRGV